MPGQGGQLCVGGGGQPCGGGGGGPPPRHVHDSIRPSRHILSASRFLRQVSPAHAPRAKVWPSGGHVTKHKNALPTVYCSAFETERRVSQNIAQFLWAPRGTVSLGRVSCQSKTLCSKLFQDYICSSGWSLHTTNVFVAEHSKAWQTGSPYRTALVAPGSPSNNLTSCRGGHRKFQCHRVNLEGTRPSCIRFTRSLSINQYTSSWLIGLGRKQWWQLISSVQLMPLLTETWSWLQSNIAQRPKEGPLSPCGLVELLSVPDCKRCSLPSLVSIAVRGHKATCFL